MVSRVKQKAAKKLCGSVVQSPEALTLCVLSNMGERCNICRARFGYRPPFL